MPWLVPVGQVVEDVGTNLGRIGVPAVLPVAVDFPVRARELEIVGGTPIPNRLMSRADLTVWPEVHHRRGTTRRSAGADDIPVIRNQVAHFDADVKANGAVPVDRDLPAAAELSGPEP